MKITICGSMDFKAKMGELKSELNSRGYGVETPNLWERGSYVGDPDADAAMKRKFIDEHFAKIALSEAILVVNEEKKGMAGYIGGNTLVEIAQAYTQGLDIFLLHEVPDISYADEIRGMHPIILANDLDRLEQHVKQLPRLWMSTTSELKHSAVARAMRRAGRPVRVDGVKVESGVNEQPLTVEETYEGAMNRHAALKKLGESAAYYVTVESGQHAIHKDHSKFGCTVVVVEPAGAAAKVGIDLDVEFPQEMLDKVPSVYPDLGVLVQEEYGAAEKDPITYITNGGLTRRQVIEGAVYNVAVQLEGSKR